jgi:hypothetical protein
METNVRFTWNAINETVDTRNFVENMIEASKYMSHNAVVEEYQLFRDRIVENFAKYGKPDKIEIF